MGTYEQNLEKTLQQLHEEGIAAGVETAVDDGMQVWVGDEARRLETTRIEPVTTAAGRRWIDAHAAARWLTETASRLFPQSRFAQRVQIDRLKPRAEALPTSGRGPAAPAPGPTCATRA